MPWIESHTVLLRHRKVLQLATELRLPPVYAMGHLHALWHTALEQQEDGDLSHWSDAMIASAAAWTGDPALFVMKMQEVAWLDGKLVHDWLDYAGLYLIRKYSSSNRARLREIWERHGCKYGKGKGKFGKAAVTCHNSLKGPKSERNVKLPNQPNQTIPDLTKPNRTVVGTRDIFLAELEAFTLTDELHDWAQSEFRVRIPNDVLDEFKGWWRGQDRLNTDLVASFKSRIRLLVTKGVLKPEEDDWRTKWAGH